jgi:hypothetical protein
MEAVQVALHLLCAFFPRDTWESLRAGLVDAIEGEFHARGMEVPPWMGRVRSEEWIDV